VIWRRGEGRNDDLIREGLQLFGGLRNRLSRLVMQSPIKVLPGNGSGKQMFGKDDECCRGKGDRNGKGPGQIGAPSFAQAGESCAAKRVPRLGVLRKKGTRRAVSKRPLSMN